MNLLRLFASLGSRILTNYFKNNKKKFATDYTDFHRFLKERFAKNNTDLFQNKKCHEFTSSVRFARVTNFD